MKRIAELRPFADLLMIERSEMSLKFLGGYRINLSELESIVHKTIAKLETPRPLIKPKSLPQPSPYEKTKFKMKDCRLKLKDIKNQSKYSYALKTFKNEHDIRIRKKKRKLLSYLTAIAENRRGESSTKRKTVAVSSDSESDSESRKQKEKSKKVRREDEPKMSDYGGFK